jgi:hypothetical protein
MSKKLSHRSIKETKHNTRNNNFLHLYHVASTICNRHSNAIMYGCNKHKTVFSNVPEINKIVVKVRWTIMFFVHFETYRNVQQK